MKQGAQAAFCQGSPSMAKPLTKLSLILLVPFRAGCFRRSHSGHTHCRGTPTHPALGCCQSLEWTGEGGAGMTNVQKHWDRGRGESPKMPWVLGASCPPFPFLQHFRTPADFGVSVSHKHADCPHLNSPPPFQVGLGHLWTPWASWSGGCTVPTVLLCTDGVGQGRRGHGYPLKRGCPTSPPLIRRPWPASTGSPQAGGWRDPPSPQMGGGGAQPSPMPVAPGQLKL